MKLFHDGETFAQMRRLLTTVDEHCPIKPPHQRYPGKPWKHVLQRDAKGQSLVGQWFTQISKRRA